jgi:hypothetical protein
VLSFGVPCVWAVEEHDPEIAIHDVFPVSVGQVRHHGWFVDRQGEQLLAAIDRRTVWRSEPAREVGASYVLVKNEHFTFGQGVYLQPNPSGRSSDIIDICVKHQLPRTVSAEIYYRDPTRLRTLGTYLLVSTEQEDAGLQMVYEGTRRADEEGKLSDLTLVKAPVRVGESFQNDETVVTIAGCGSERSDHHKVTGRCIKSSLAQTMSGPVERYFEVGVGVIRERFVGREGPVTIELLDW